MLSFRSFSLVVALTGCTAAAPGDAPDGDLSLASSLSLPLRGVNLAGAEFAESNIPGTVGVHYAYPTTAEIEYFVGKGMTTLRIPFLWERLQRAEGAAFDADELARLDAAVTATTSRGAFALIDPHNYARYHGQVIGGGVPNASFADLWRRLADHYRNNPRVVFGLMNEPNTMPTEQWLAAANAAIASIRATGATNLILVPGNAWTGAHSWTQSWYGTPNGQVMLGVVDPGNNYAFEVHQYLDSDSSGTNPGCVDATVGTRRMQELTAWLRAHGKRAFLGEFGATGDATCVAALRDLLGHLHANSDVYLGWTYWAAGPMWGDYMFTVEPKDGVDRPQMAALRDFLQPPTGGGGGGSGSGGGGGGGSGGGSGSGGSGSGGTGSGSSAGSGDGSATSALSATVLRTTSWTGGYCVDVQIKNQGTTPVDGWRVVFRPFDARVTQSWSVVAETGGLAFHNLDADWNRVIAPGGTVAFGLCADITGPAPYPSVERVTR